MKREAWILLPEALIDPLLFNLYLQVTNNESTVGPQPKLPGLYLNNSTTKIKKLCYGYGCFCFDTISGELVEVLL